MSSRSHLTHRGRVRCLRDTLRLLFFFLLWPAAVHGHVISQLAADFHKEENGWKLVVFFDAGYAKPEWRGDPNSAQPTHDWLIARSRQEQRKLCAEAADYLADCLQFTGGGNNVPVDYHFPDFDTEPPAFPEMLNGGAYFRVVIRPGSAEPRLGTTRAHAAQVGSGLRITARQAKQPDFAILLPPENGGEERYLTLKSGNEAVLVAADTPSAESEVHGLSGLPYALKEGYLHVLPTGMDHVLFVLGIFLLVRKGKPLLWQSLAFTVAHTLTLGLTAAGFLAPRMDWVEAAIALSIAFLAVENLFWKELKPWRLFLVFGFGLIHGMGFASALGSVLRVGENGFLPRLLMANLGVELAQLSIIAGAWLLTMGWSKSTTYPRFRLVANLTLAAVALWWFSGRI